jgi:hypothetical protein
MPSACAMAGSSSKAREVSPSAALRIDLIAAPLRGGLSRTCFGACPELASGTCPELSSGSYPGGAEGSDKTLAHFLHLIV